ANPSGSKEPPASFSEVSMTWTRGGGQRQETPSPSPKLHIGVTGLQQDATTLAPVIRGVLCSDYYPAALLHYPAALLHAVMSLVTGGDAALPEAFRLVTLNPARALGLDDALGSIEPGKTVDLIVIDEHGGVPVVTRTLRDGREVLAVG